MSHLLDANVLIALVVDEHEHHDVASEWFEGIAAAVVCPIVEGALLRFLLRVGERADTARVLLEQVHAHPRMGFIADTLSYRDAPWGDLVGHRQLTAAYLAALAEAHGLTLATLDAALSRLRPHSTELILAT